MKDTNFSNNNKYKYDTTINIIGGIKDYSILWKSIETYFNEDDTIENLLINRNEFSLRTEQSRKRILRAINSSFLFFKNDDHRCLVKTVLSHSQSVELKQLLIFWQFALNNKLFFDITTEVFVKSYLSGRSSFPKDDIIAYLKHVIIENRSLKLHWSESTLNTISTKYLNFLTKLNLIEGSRIKRFKHIQLTNESLVIFLYYLKLFNPLCVNALDNGLLPLSFLSPESFRERVKKLAQIGYVDMSFDGIVMKIELRYSFSGVSDAIYS